MEATGYKVFNDSVHGHITLHPLLVKVIDTPEFQRLRNLKQLGLGYYVYPGAGHCRYEHSLGTCYLAGQMVEKLLSRDPIWSQEEGPVESLKRAPKRSPKEVMRLTLCVQLAALCHDLGHGPFSHTWELVVKRWGEHWRHETSSNELFDYLMEKNNLKGEFSRYDLGDTEIAIVKELIMGRPYTTRPLLKPRDHFLYEIVNNKETGIDVDKWDYFLRDGLHLNLRITFDYRRLLEFCAVMYYGDTTHIAFRDKELLNLYDMYRVRSILHHTAYRHKVVNNIEFMFIDAFEIAGNAGYLVNSKFLMKEAHKSAEWMSELTDHVFYDILYSTDPRLQEAQVILQRVQKRDLYFFVGRAIISAQGRRDEIEAKKKSLEKQLVKHFPQYKFCVGDFYLDLDTAKDPVSNAHFYKKSKDEKGVRIKPQHYECIRSDLSPLPFQLTSESTAELLVFCKTQLNADEKKDLKADAEMKVFKNST